jgi:hypothetical protein
VYFVVIFSVLIGQCSRPLDAFQWLEEFAKSTPACLIIDNPTLLVTSKIPVASDQRVTFGNYTSSCDSSVEKKTGRTKKYLMQGIQFFCLI